MTRNVLIVFVASIFRTALFGQQVRPARGATMQFVDQKTAFDPPASIKLTGGKIRLSGYAVAVVTL